MKNTKSIVQSLKGGLTKHSPEILTGIGVTGMLTAMVLAVKNTPKALILLEEKKREKRNEQLEQVKAESEANETVNTEETEPAVATLKLTPAEVVKTAWTCYIPAAVTAACSIACLIGASSVSSRRNAALATAYSLSESAMKTYQQKVVETIGEKKEAEVRDAVAEEKLKQNPVTSQEIILTEKGDALCYDVISGRYFRSDMETLKKAENDLNRRMRDEMYISLNEFYYEIGLPGVKDCIGEDLGWSMDEGYIELRFSAQLTDDGKPCIVVDYQVAPRYEYR